MGDGGQVIIVTGSTRGIGYGLADAFLARGCKVGVCGRAEPAVEDAVAALSKAHDPGRVWGHPCDVTQYDQVRALWDDIVDHLGRIDIWINNAGLGNPPRDFWEHPPELVDATVRTNLLGAMYGCQVALRGMLAQGFGQLYNMEGLGSDGGRVSGLTLYGTTKYGIRYLTDSLVRETRGSPVLVGALSPGMVVTDFLIRPYDDRPEEWERARRIFNILADRVETVTPWLAGKVLANTRTGVHFSWLTRIKVVGRFLMAPFRKRDLFYDVPGPGSNSRSS